MHPKLVKSPVNRTRNHRKLYVSPDGDDNWSLCEAEVFNPETDKWTLHVGIRWDGDRENDHDKGFPNTSGQAVWFWLPREIEQIIRAGIGHLSLLDEVKKLRKKQKKLRKREMAEA